MLNDFFPFLDGFQKNIFKARLGSDNSQISFNYLQIKVALKILILVFDLGLGMLIVEGPFKY